LEKDMTTFAAIAFDPVTVAGWLVVGLAFGWLVNKTMEAPSYGAIGDIGLHRRLCPHCRCSRRRGVPE
jgi:hypothetical protein